MNGTNDLGPSIGPTKTAGPGPHAEVVNAPVRHVLQVQPSDAEGPAPPDGRAGCLRTIGYTIEITLLIPEHSTNKDGKSKWRKPNSMLQLCYIRCIQVGVTF